MDRPNVVLITLDTTRKDRLGCYGYDRDTSPAIDAFAQNATLYEDATTAGIWSLPSHASIFTGEYPHDHGATTVSPFLATDDTLAQRLNDHGYTTIGIAPNFVVRPSAGITDGFDSFDTPQVRQLPGPLINIYQRYSDLTASSIPLRKISETIWRLYRDHLQSRDTPDKERKRASETVEQVEETIPELDEPFFLFINQMEPHLPHHPEARFREGFVDENLDVDAPKEQESYNTGDNEITDEQKELLSQLYDADIRTMDHNVGRILQQLKDQGHWDDTMIILVGDHGEHLGEDGMVGHELSVADELTDVPLIVKEPGQQDGRTVDQPVETRRLFHTILDRTIDDRDDLEDDTVAAGEYVPPLIDITALRDNDEIRYTDTTDSPMMYARNSQGKLIIHNGTEHSDDLTDDGRQELRDAIRNRLRPQD